jgi:hypothetical protein
MKTMIDPPYGWRYGFPKALPDDISPDNPKQIRAWLLSEGYPERDVDFAMSYCRFWEQDENSNREE